MRTRCRSRTKLRRCVNASTEPEASSGAAGVLTQLKKLESEGCAQMPVCIAKTQYSFSDNPKLLGAPEGFEVTIRSVRLSRGAGFVVAFAGDIIAMPGLPPQPAADGIGVDENGEIFGLF